MAYLTSPRQACSTAGEACAGALAQLLLLAPVEEATAWRSPRGGASRTAALLVRASESAAAAALLDGPLLRRLAALAWLAPGGAQAWRGPAAAEACEALRRVAALPTTRARSHVLKAMVRLQPAYSSCDRLAIKCCCDAI